MIKWKSFHQQNNQKKDFSKLVYLIAKFIQIIWFPINVNEEKKSEIYFAE